MPWCVNTVAATLGLSLNSFFICLNFYFSYNDVEKDTVAMVLYHLLASSHIDNDVKSRIRIAAGLGRQDHCSLYTCELNLQVS